jgi:glycogen operon protein
VEGPTTNPEVRALRLKQSRNFLATLLLSQGVPMITAGDEIGRTQRGNNNAYCQDNETSWIQWPLVTEDDADLLAFTQRLIALRKEHIVLHRSRFIQSHEIPGTNVKDVTWVRPDGAEMTGEDWEEASNRRLGVLLSGEAGLRFLTETGEPEPDDTFLLILNASHEAVEWALPPCSVGFVWELVFDTTEGFVEPAAADEEERGVRPDQSYRLGPRSSALMIRAEIAPA